MTESIVLDDTNSDLHSNIPSVLPNNNPHDNLSILLLTTQPDPIHQNQVIQYNNDQLEEAKHVYNNHITDSSRLQYLSANTALVIFYSKIIVLLYFNLILINTKNSMRMNHLIYLQKKVRDSLQ